jgi:phosphoribosylamine--glycine ligase
LAQQKSPYVIKADGLAAGKGVLICATPDAAEAAIDQILVHKTFGAAGNNVVIEEFLTGEEASFMALTDGEHVLPLATSQDHKRVFDNDQGPQHRRHGRLLARPGRNCGGPGPIPHEVLMPLLKV